MGRPKGSGKAIPGFDFSSVNGKYSAVCHLCDQTLANTARSRLEAHRKLCARRNHEDKDKRTKRKRINSDSDSSSEVSSCSYTSSNRKSENPSPDNGHTGITINPGENLFSTLDQAIRSDCDSYLEVAFNAAGDELIRDYSSRSSNSSRPACSHSSTSTYDEEKNRNVSIGSASSLLGLSNSGPSFSSRSTDKVKVKSPEFPESNNKTHQMSMRNYLDTLTSKDKEDIMEKIANFFFGCNIPFNVINSLHFRNLIGALRPAFLPFLPRRKKLSTSMLGAAYNRCINTTKSSKMKESVLLIDGYKNTSSNTRTVVTMLDTGSSNTSRAFLNAWDITSTAETGDLLAEIVQESVELAVSKYNTEVYAVVSDNAANMRKMGNTITLWYSNCKSHTGNLLAKDILDEHVKERALSVVREFKQADLEALVVKYGGLRFKTPCDTRWNSYRDCYQRILMNLNPMKKVMCDSSHNKKVKSKIQQILVDDTFINDLQNQIAILNPVAEVVNFCQRKESSTAEAANMWLNLQLPNASSEVLEKLSNRKIMALDIYSLSAYYLHPRFFDGAQEKLEEFGAFDIVQDFLITELDASGVSSLAKYQQKEEIFGKLFAKKMQTGIDFWTLVSGTERHKNLATLAKKLLLLPASSAQLERIFSQWAYIHCPIRNRLTFENSKKLLHIYYTLKLSDIPEEDEEDDDDD